MILIKNVVLEPLDNETVLDCLLRNGMAPPHSCRSGLCQSCMLRSVKGKPPADSQHGLKSSLKLQNYFLACRCIPQHDMEISFADAQLFRKPATIIDRTMLTDSVLRLRIARPDNFSYYAGQFTTIFKDEDVGRSYSLASVPHLDEFLEYHIKLIPGGKISQWLLNESFQGKSLTISEALGNCVYIKGEETRPIALIATGTGLSPVYGVLRDAISNKHQGEIRLYHGAYTSKDLYLDRQLRELNSQFENFSYIPCVSNDGSAFGIRHGSATEIATSDIGNFSGWRVYISGNPDIVMSGQRQIFLAGASLKDIHSDPFVYS